MISPCKLTLEYKLSFHLSSSQDSPTHNYYHILAPDCHPTHDPTNSISQYTQNCSFTMSFPLNNNTHNTLRYLAEKFCQFSVTFFTMLPILFMLSTLDEHGFLGNGVFQRMYARHMLNQARHKHHVLTYPYQHRDRVVPGRNHQFRPRLPQ